MSSETGGLNRIPFTIRELRDEDLPFIYNSYLKSYRQYVPFMSDTDFYTIHHERFQRFLNDGSTTFVVSLTDDPSTIVGWATFKVVSNAVIFYYLYIKHVYRGFKLSDTILQYIRDTLPDQALITLTMTPKMVKLQRAYNVLYRPYYLEE